MVVVWLLVVLVQCILQSVCMDVEHFFWEGHFDSSLVPRPSKVITAPALITLDAWE